MEIPPNPPDAANSTIKSVHAPTPPPVNNASGFKKIIFWILDRILLVLVALAIPLIIVYFALPILEDKKIDRKLERIIESSTVSFSNSVKSAIDEPLISNNPQNIGRNSLKFYKSYLEEQVTCQAKAAAIRTCVEVILGKINQNNITGFSAYADPRVTGLSKALRTCSGYYNRSTKFRSSLSNENVDQSIVSFVDKINNLDQETAIAYNIYAQDPTHSGNLLINMSTKRQAFYQENEQALINSFESKYGLKLPTRGQIYEEVKQKALNSTQTFLNAQEPKKLSEFLIGSTLTDVMSGEAWIVRPGEYISGKIIKSTPDFGSCALEVEMVFSSVNIGNSAKIHAMLIGAEDPDLNIIWFYYITDAR